LWSGWRGARGRAAASQHPSGFRAATDLRNRVVTQGGVRRRSNRAAAKTGRLGGIVDNSDAKIVWNKGINDQGDDFETFYGKENPDVRRLPPGSTAFDYFNDATGEAVSTKTLNTQTAYYIKNPQKIFKQVKEYVDDVIDYERLRETDPDPDDIQSKTIHLAIPEYTSPTQWRYLNRVIIYAKDNGISLVITRIRE
jgi:hypothetical protein